VTALAARLRAPRRLGGRSAIAVAATLAVLLALWCATAAAFAETKIVPFPWVLAARLVEDWNLLAINAGATLATAVGGLLAGVAVVLPLTALCLLLPAAEPIVMRVAVVVHVIPFVAIAPILVVSLPLESSRIVIAALQVYFPLLIGLLLGLRSADAAALDVVTASGGRNAARLRFVRVASAVPHLVAGLQIGVPAAVLGAVIAEFFGADRGLGAIIVTSQQAFLTDRTWAIAVFIGAVAAIGYGLVTLAARLIVPWAGRGAGVGTGVAGAETLHLRRREAVLGAGVSLALLLGFWQSLRTVFDFPAFFTKTPGDVVAFLTQGHPITGAPASEFWGVFGTALGQTVVDATVGFVVGTIIAIAVAVLFVAVPAIGAAVMPLAVVLRSIPLLALTPLLVLMFGRGLLGVTVLVTLVTFFPTLVTVMTGLRSTPEGALDVVKASGGTAATAARRVRLLYAVPSITAAAKVAIPNAIAGATLAEWLATGRGLGQLLTLSSVQADYITLWAAGALLVLFVLAVYAAVGWLDRLVSARLGVTA
jgi:ABC-type nitrate/sulfonate/bicarbonate transport system permease component